jgi:hypothetical protein
MNQFLEQLRSFVAKNGYLMIVVGVTVVAVAASEWVAIPARRQAALLAAEAETLSGIIKSSEAWVSGFQPASNEESALWQNTDYEVKSLGVAPAERLTLAQIIARRADQSGLFDYRLKFLAPEGTMAPPRQVAGITFNPAPYKIQVTGTGGFGSLGSLIGSLPPAVELQSIRLARDSADRVGTSLTLSVFEPAGGNAK